MFSERELERRARHRLEILTHAEEVSGSIALHYLTRNY